MTPPSPRPAFDFGRLLRLARKELSESLRDRRTILTLVLMPLLLYPLLAVAFRTMVLSGKVGPDRPAYGLGFASAAEKDAFLRRLMLGHQAVKLHNASPEQRERVLQARSPQARSRLLDELPEPAHLAPMPELKWKEVPPDQMEAEVLAKTVHVAVRLKPSGGGGELDPRAVDCELLYNKDVPEGVRCARYLELLAAEANDPVLREYLRGGLEGARPKADALWVRPVAVADPAAEASSPLSVLVPLILVLMTMTGAVYPAIDLTAGERERGTLEILVAAPIPRMSLLLAKYVAVLTVALLTALVNLGTMVVTLQASGLGQALFPDELSWKVLVQVLGLLVLFAAFFAAALLALTSFARSFKEAQAYLIPVMLLALAPGMAALMPGLELRGPLAVVPLMNIVLLARDVFKGSATPGDAGVVIAATAVYAVAALGLAARVFGTEAVLSSGQAGWADLFRRPARPRAVPEPSAALLCLALMFPTYFLLTGTVAQVELSPGGRLGLITLANFVLFGGFPLLAAWVGNVRLASGFRLAAPGVVGCAAALLLGLTLWPFVHELTLWLRSAGVATLRPELLERLQETLAQWRAFPPAVVVLALAVVPAVLEELFFRGYLFSALRASTPRAGPVVFGSAALFALFHLLVTDSLAVERLPASFLMGVVLGWVAWRTGSVFPGMVLHTAHNGFIVLLGYYKPQLEARGWVPSGDDHLPAWLLLAAAAGAALGALALWRFGARGEPRG